MANPAILIGFFAATLAIGLVVGAFVRVYRRKSPVAMPISKPGFCWLPKYYLEIEVPDSIVFSDDPIAELDRHLEPYGFRETHRDRATVKFARVSTLGDFSVNISRVHLVFSLPLEHDIRIVIEYGGLTFFDAGGLWAFTNELRSKFELEYVN